MIHPEVLMGVDASWQRTVIDRFEGGISPYWVRFAVGRGEIERAPEMVLFSLEGAGAGELSDAEINDHRHHARENFPWTPPLSMEVRARFSHPAGELLGTAGFGFWNAPYDWEGGIGVPPNWVWFFYASPPSDVSLTPGQPGNGWKAAMLNGGKGMGPLMGLVDLVTRMPLTSRVFLGLAYRTLSMGDRLLDTDMTGWHTYSLQWRREAALFQVDGREVYRVAKPPTLPLGFVAWMDNNCASMTPAGGLETRLLAVPHRQWLEIDYIEISEE